VLAEGQELIIQWPSGNSSCLWLSVSMDRRPRAPLVRRIAWARQREGPYQTLMEELEPVWFLTVGSRQTPPGKPPWQKWLVFFDNPATRPHKTYGLTVRRTGFSVSSQLKRAVVSCGVVQGETFTGEARLRLFSGSDLIQFEAAVTTSEDRKAILYDAGLIWIGSVPESVAWIDEEGQPTEVKASELGAAQPVHVKFRTILATTAGGSVAVFPPPHQYFFPRDFTDNLGFTWLGRNVQGTGWPLGFGIRQARTGGGNWVPWFNAPPGQEHRLSFFVLAHPGPWARGLAAVQRYTRSDRFVPLEGYKTFTSHYHLAAAVTAMERMAQGLPPVAEPDFVRAFRDMGVQMVHLAEFHGDGHPQDPGPLRLQELDWMFRECRRLSDSEFLLLPGEEGNAFLGIQEPGKHPGHWMLLFPRPVYWIQQRKPEQPSAEWNAAYGRVYRVGSREDMVRLIRAEGALVWTSHPRIKASSWAPDIFRKEDFFLARSWLGAAWKAMPADLSDDRLGRRALDLLDDMCNWGVRKFLVGEVDVFRIDLTHELYGHMNINYLKLESLPSWDQGWGEVLKALQRGDFFVTTGEVLIPVFSVDGVPAGGTVPRKGRNALPIRVQLRWTFPLNFLEIVSGDGYRVYRDRIDLSRTAAFGQEDLELSWPSANRKWLRLEVWDIATNGAFTQPVWIEDR
jgi:hypothetical protein